MSWGDDADALLGETAPAKAAPPAAPRLPEPRRLPKLGGPISAPAPAGPSGDDSFFRGGLQGITSGFGDELSARIDQGASKVPGLRDLAQSLAAPGSPAINDPNVPYEQRRDFYRGLNDQARGAHPKTFLAGELLGAGAQRAIPGVGQLSPVASGAVAGAGYSKADNVNDLAGDVILGGAAGKLGEVAGKVAGTAARKVIEKAPAAADALAEKALGTEGREVLRKQLWAARERVMRVVKGDPELRRAIGDPGKILDVAAAKLPALNEATGKIYAAADEAAGGLQPSEILAPLNQIKNDMVRDSADGAQARAVSKVIDEFADGLGKNPSAGAKGQGGPQYLIPAERIRKWLTDRLGPGSKPLDRDSGEIEKATAAAGVKVREILQQYVARNAGPEAAEQLTAANDKISALSLLSRVAEDAVRRESQGPGAVTSIARALAGRKAEGIGAGIGYAVGGPVGGIVGAGAGATARKAVPEIVNAAASPAGQAIGRGAPAAGAFAGRTLSQPTIEALVTGDAKARAAALHREVFGR